MAGVEWLWCLSFPAVTQLMTEAASIISLTMSDTRLSNEILRPEQLMISLTLIILVRKIDLPHHNFSLSFIFTSNKEVIVLVCESVHQSVSMFVSRMPQKL